MKKVMIMVNKNVYIFLLLTACNSIMPTGFKRKSINGSNRMSSIKKEALNHALGLAIDMYEKEGNLIVKMDIPGVEFNDVQVEIEDGQLHVFGERKAHEEVSQGYYHYKEVGYGRFDRLISLPTDTDKAGMTYEVENGVLKVIIPK